MSGRSPPITAAVFVIDPAAVTMARTVNVAFVATPEPGASSAPIVQMPVSGTYVPCDALADANVSPAGSTSRTRTPVACCGPSFAAMIVNVTTSPTTGARRSSVITTATSALSPAVAVPVMGPAATDGTPRRALDKGLDLEQHVQDLEREYIAEALRRSGGVKVKAAELLGMSFRSFRYYMKKYNLK